MTRMFLSGTVLALATIMTARAASAALYTTIDLLPSAEGFAAADSTQAGDSLVGTETHAWIWHGATPGTDINPAGAFYSQAFATTTNTQVGRANLNVLDTTHAFDHAYLWNSTAASALDLHTFLPAGFDNSGALGIAGNVIGGFAINTAGSTHAILWNGSGLSYTTTDLHLTLPVAGNFTDSEVTSTDATSAAGFVTNTSGQQFAAVWNVGSTVFTQLPGGGDSASAFGVANAQVVGFGTATSDMHALLWTQTGVVYTPTDLHGTDPAWLTSEALATNGTREVGFKTSPTGTTHAFLWAGSAASAIDLNQFLPAGYTDSMATGIDPWGNIVGTALDSDGISHAILWTPEPTSLSVLAIGLLTLTRRRPTR